MLDRISFKNYSRNFYADFITQLIIFTLVAAHKQIAMDFISSGLIIKNAPKERERVIDLKGSAKVIAFWPEINDVVERK